MPGLLESLLGEDTETVDKLRSHTGDDPQRAEQAYGAAVGTILRGLEAKSQTKEGAKGLWDMLRKQVEQGNVPAEAPAPGSGVQVRDMDPKAVNDIFKEIFGKDAPAVEGGFGKVVTLDAETSKKVFEKVLPTILGSIFGAAEKAPQDSAEALPNIVTDARKEMEERQPKSSNIFAAIFDRDHDGDVDLEDLAGMLPRKPK